MSRFHLPVLPWPTNSLEPFLSGETIETHYYGHHKGYVEKTNELMSKLGLENMSLEKIILNYDGTLFDNAAQAWNHTFYWLGLVPRAEYPDDESSLMQSITSQFGSMDAMKEKLADCASSLFGSGYTWLVVNDRGELDFINTHNADNPLRFQSVRPIWTCDVWEHAYYLDYRNQRKEYIDAIWDHINWEFVEKCLSEERIPNMSALMIEPPISEKPRPHA